MILKIPTGALILGLSGVLPFAWGAVTLLSEEAFNFGIENFGARFVGPLIQLSYGVIILCFMSGVLWGFATKMDEKMEAWDTFYPSFQHYGPSFQWAEDQLVIQSV